MPPSSRHALHLHVRITNEGGITPRAIFTSKSFSTQVFPDTVILAKAPQLSIVSCAFSPKPRIFVAAVRCETRPHVTIGGCAHGRSRNDSHTLDGVCRAEFGSCAPESSERRSLVAAVAGARFID